MKKHIPSWINRLHLAVTVLTRLPVPEIQVDGKDSVAQSMSMFPLVGILIGGIGGGVFCGLTHLITPLPAALIAIAATLILTGALHEDGLADLADGLGARGDRIVRLSVMRDPHVGSFGAGALILSIGLRGALLSSAPDGWAGLLAMIAVAVLSRAAIPAIMQVLPPARTDGLGAEAGVPDFSTTALAAAMALIFALLCLSFAPTLAALTGAIAGTVTVAWVARRALGGYTGDVLGAVQQMAEIGAFIGVASQW